MSERMIEIMRAKMGMGTAPVRTSSTSNAVPIMQEHDKKLQTFLQMLNSEQNFTVPTALSRRVLHRQGVDYLDENVAAVVSLAADRFLATVLHQAMVCRDRRIKGKDLLKKRRKEEKIWRRRKRSEMEEKEERSMERQQKRKELNMMAIAAAQALPDGKAQGNAAGGSAKKKRSKKSKSDANANSEIANGKLDAEALAELAKDPKDDEEFSDASEEEYDEYVKGQLLDHDSDAGSSHDDDDEEEEDEDDEDEEMRFVLKLRDLQRPLEAWGVTLAGKLGLGEVDMEFKTSVVSEQRDMEDGDVAASAMMDVGMDTDGNSVMGNSMAGDATSVTSKKKRKAKSDDRSESGKTMASTGASSKAIDS